jgi:hypothetical protein
MTKETLDEDMWRLLEKKYRDIGEFVDGDENAQVIVNASYMNLLDVLTHFRLQT